jgi:hypothetical protein
LRRVLNIDIWNFIGIWCLKFVLYQYPKCQDNNSCLLFKVS